MSLCDLNRVLCFSPQVFKFSFLSFEKFVTIHQTTKLKPIKTLPLVADWVTAPSLAADYSTIWLYIKGLFGYSDTGWIVEDLGKIILVNPLQTSSSRE
jgi:hypothetical protein